MPQHSFGRSSRACATISSTKAWEIFTPARLLNRPRLPTFEKAVELRRPFADLTAFAHAEVTDADPAEPGREERVAGFAGRPRQRLAGLAEGRVELALAGDPQQVWGRRFAPGQRHGRAFAALDRIRDLE